MGRGRDISYIDYVRQVSQTAWTPHSAHLQMGTVIVSKTRDVIDSANKSVILFICIESIAYYLHALRTQRFRLVQIII